MSTINRSPAGDSWRLVYKETDLISLVRSAGVTSTINTLEVFPIENGDPDPAKALADARILELGLKNPNAVL